MILRGDFEKLGTLPLIDLDKEHDAKKYVIRVTSGTTGNLPLVIVRRKKTKRDRKGFYFGLKRVAGFFGSLNARVSHLSFVIFRKENPAGIFLDYHDLNPDIDAILRQFNPDSFCGFPSFIISALRYIKDPTILSGVKSVRLTGEGLSPQKMKILKSKFPNASIYLFYAAAEVGFISEFCPNLPIGQYHPKEGSMKVDIINQDEQGMGDIIVSTNLSPSVKVDDYRIGDVGRFVKLADHCKCGRKITFEVLGRKNFDFIKMCGGVLIQREFERVALELKEYIIDFRAYAEEAIIEEVISGKISLDIIPSAKLSQLDHPGVFLAEEFSKRLFVTPTQTLKDLIHKNHFLPIQVTLKTDLPWGHKDVKMKIIRR